MNDLAGAGASFTADKLVPKGLKAVKGAKMSAEAEEFAATSKVAKPAPKKAAANKQAPSSGDDEEGDEEVLEFGLASTPNEKPASKSGKKPAAKKRKVQQIEPSDIPEGKVDLPSAAEEMESAFLEAEAEEEDED